MRKSKALAIGVAVMMLFMAVSFISQTVEGAPNGKKVLFDMGNGTTVWADVLAESGDTIDDVLDRTAAANGIDYELVAGVIKINGLDNTTIGDPAGTVTDMKTSGTTGETVPSKWYAYRWDATGKTWVPENVTNAYTGTHIAVAFYPEDPILPGVPVLPVETPDHPNAWTMVRGNAEQTGEQDYIPDSAKEASVRSAVTRGGTSGVYSSVLTVQGYVFVKFGTGASGGDNRPSVRCYDANDLSGPPVWEFLYDGVASYETASMVIAGDYIYVTAALGYIYRMPWRTGPGAGNADVIDVEIPSSTGVTLEGFTYTTGPGSPVFDSGCLFTQCSNGMVYCFNMDLDLVWASQMTGCSYYMSPTVFDGYVAAGALNGRLYIMDKTNGDQVIAGGVEVYTEPYNSSNPGIIRGSVSSSVVVRTGVDKYRLIFSFSSGRGMETRHGGIGIYDFDAAAGTVVPARPLLLDVFGLVSNYLQPVMNDDFQGVYFTSSKGLFKMNINGEYKLLNDSMYNIKAPPTLVNGDTIFLVSYEPRKPVYQVDLDGKILSLYAQQTTVSNYGMSPVVIVNGMVFYGNDSGVIGISGTFQEYIEPVSSGSIWDSPLFILFLIILIIALIIGAIYAVMRLKGIEKPFSHLKGKMTHYVGGEDLLHNTRSKHRLLIMILAGAAITFIVAVICLCVGFNSIMSVGEMFSSLFSAISKGGSALNYNELVVFESRLPRTLMALAVGIGLSVAGCMYQAIIRNPLVDPYIMGVSAGAGTAAVAVIGMNFTLFGLFSPHSIYLTAVCAIVGGIAAFFVTMLLAEKAGGSSLNYVLAGVVIGLALSSIQSVMLSMAGHQVSNALGWLFGSFANVSWSHIRLVIVPILALSLVPLFWAREFNLVLLGEDQARQMGLNVRRFSRLMLVIASALTALCVAFVGIIGFVGLVIPHVCRMILGGDHRLVLPASIAIGGALMMLADLASRTLYYGQELPVGAITTMIGVPVFAYLLIRRGKLYDG